MEFLLSIKKEWAAETWSNVWMNLKNVREPELHTTPSYMIPYIWQT